jgi:hypothetical protein
MWSLGTTSSTDHQRLTNIVTGCSTSNHTDYLSHDTNTWIQLQEAHDRVKSRYASDWDSNGHSRASKGGSESIPHSGMQVPFEIKLNPKNGLRQVVVTRDIPEGYTMWKPLHYHTFRNEHPYVEFLEELPHHLQCEALSWTHASFMDNEMYVDITLDEGSFIETSSSLEDINIDVNCVALRDIKAGEFVYMNHTDFIPPPTESSSSSPFSESGVEWFDDLRSTAWKRTGLGMGRRAYASLDDNSHRREPTPQSIAPGVAILSALYVVTKFLRGKSSQKSFHANNDDCDYGASFFYTQKTKLA